MTTPNINLDVLMPITYTGTFAGETGQADFTINRQKVQRVAVPFTGQVMVQIVSGTETPVFGYANGGGYKFANLVKATGSAGNWRCVYNVVVNKGQTVDVYPYVGSNDGHAKNVGAPVSITFFPMGEHKN